MHDENQRGMLSRRNERCKPAYNAGEWTYEKFAKKTILKRKVRALALVLALFIMLSRPALFSMPS